LPRVEAPCSALTGSIASPRSAVNDTQCLALTLSGCQRHSVAATPSTITAGMAATVEATAKMSAVNPTSVAVMAGLAVMMTRVMAVVMMTVLVMAVVLVAVSVASCVERKNLRTRRAAAEAGAWAPRRALPGGPGESQHDHDQEQCDDYTEGCGHVLHLRSCDGPLLPMEHCCRNNYCPLATVTLR